jgi:hypothetical protein
LIGTREGSDGQYLSGARIDIDSEPIKGGDKDNPEDRFQKYSDKGVLFDPFREGFNQS